jgi:hypothetical protein
MFYAMGFVTDWIGAPLALGMAGLIVGIGAPLSLWLSGAVRSVRTAPDPVVFATVDQEVSRR